MFHKSGVNLRNWAKSSVWVFPAAALIILLLLTALRISGSSVGAYYPKLYGPGVKNTNLIYGVPKSIRSDEWLVLTQTTIAQSKLGYPRVNTHMTGGQDLSLQAELPVKDWSAVFKPQNWSFFVLPLEYAFAFKWWLLMYLLMVSCYFFVLRVLPGQKLFAAVFSIAIGLSPFELWWYQSGGFLTVAYGFMIAILIMRLINKEKVRFIKKSWLANTVQVTALAFLMTCFGLILYPPFQIPIAIVLFFFVVGYILQKRFNERISTKALAKPIGLIVVSMVIAGMLGGLFIATHRTPIDALNNSIYPGHRTVESGNLKFLSVFDSYVMPLEQSDLRGAHFITNQSEDSNFILLLPFLLIPGFALIAREWRQHRRIDWILLALQVCALLLFIRVFTPYGQDLFRLLLLHRVPNKRIIIGLGFLGVLQLLYLSKKLRELKLPKAKLNLWAGAYAFACFIVLVLISLYIKHHYPTFVLNSFAVVIGLAGLFGAIIFALLSDRRLLFVGLLLLLTLGSTFRIIPLYRGLDVLTNSEVVAKMAAISKPQDTWVTVGDDANVYENFGLLAGRRSLSGIQFYPNVKFWQKAFGSQYARIYNRQGHAFFSDNPELKDPINLMQSDAFRVKFQCSSFIRDNVQFALSVHPLTQPCVHLVDTARYTATTFYMYSLTK